ncbi:hypothetical protein [Gracilimonas mengyeensis]|uniref:Outer membrane protein beta-barrel domain-containing protein n=1 Tax=Gracilimonas mengyeensis TaxID=1302730 RepID=A0A521BBD9_9BACT|nr:hypothetical protein [Gracilimonas mengyeensis]SMO44301.1 hypothetical protein SAMN06265219_102151 [Gracilimonas mengyeensis]
MKISSNILIFLSVIIIVQQPVKAQFYVNLDAGLVKQNIELNNFGDNYYQQTTPSLINVGVFVKTDNYRWNVDFTSQSSRLEPMIEEIDYYDTHFVDVSRHELGVEHLRKVEEPSKGLDIFLGLGYKAQLSDYSKRIESKFIERTTDFKESVVFDLSILGALEYSVEEKLIHAKVGMGVLSYRFTKEENWYRDKNFIGIGPALMLELESKIYVRIPVAPGIFLKPEYSLKYYRYERYSEMKALQQYFLLGGVIQL